MTHEEAIARCAELNRTGNPEQHWFPREGADGEWEVVSVTAEGIRRRDPLKATIEAKPRPREQPDPRPANFRNVPPFGGA
jgi:hypothetical protein